MKQAVPTSRGNKAPDVVQVTPPLFLAAARRLVSQVNTDVDSAAKRLIDSASAHGIDLGNCWVTLEPGTSSPKVRQACLAVLGAGRTCMVFVSEPDRAGEDARAADERRACADAACTTMMRTMPDRVHIAQSLPEPDERWALAAVLGAGFIKVGDLSYMRRESKPSRHRHAPDGPTGLPDGITAERVSRLPEALRDSLLIAALDASYDDTLDCPELCGLRDTADVLVSHRSVGKQDDSLWWVISENNTPLGCCLMNLCPDQRSAELVYLGLGPTLRGRGVAKSILAYAMDESLAGRPGWSVTCAVDDRNTPALALYRRLGFKSFANRTALVRSLRPAAS